MAMKNRSPHQFSKPKQERVYDMSKQDNFLFNKTPILASALQRLKKHESGEKKIKPSNTPTTKAHANIKPEDLDIQARPVKKVKKSESEAYMPSFAYTPLTKDLYNFYTINKISLKTMESVPEPKFEVGSVILTAICDRGIGGKYLVTNLFRNKKGYIDYREVSQSHAGKEDYAGIESYHEAGDYVICTVVKSMNQNHLQLSLSKFIDLDAKNFRTGQVLPAEIKSKEELGCHLSVDKCKDYKFFLPKGELEDELFNSLTQKKQVIITIADIDHTKHLIKVKLSSEEHSGLNLRGVEEEDMSKMQLEQYVSPGTLVNTKVLKVLKNGLMVKFLKIFVGFIHEDHLDNNLDFYAVDSKLEARIIYSCLNPPFIYLSQRHVNLNKYEPKRALYSTVNKPEPLANIQGSFFNKQEEFFVHPSQLHSEIENVGKFWVKENNYFERYQIMSSRKLGLRIGEVAKEIPFNNFKIFGEGEGTKFKVMCLDVWNKVVKVSYDEKFIKSTNMLFDLEEVNLQKQYCGIIKGLNNNGIIVEFCNNIRGTLPKAELKKQEIEVNETNIGKSIEVYISHIKPKKNFVTLSIVPPTMRTNSTKPNKTHAQNQNQDDNEGDEESYHGSIVSIDPKSINPIYIKLKSKLVKISVFNGIRPASSHNLPVIQGLGEHYKVSQNVRVFRKGKQYFLYPPEQLSDKNLKVCKVVGQKGAVLRLQIGKSEFKNCHICDVTDIITPYPFAEVKVGEYKIGRVLNNGMICLRDSIVINGIPKTMIECKEKYAADELRGDYRNRLLTVGSAGLKQDTVLFGYVKMFSEKGCFISISNDFDVRVEMSELTDDYIPDKTKFYPLNKLMLVRLISEKVKPSDPSKHLFDASARASVVKMGYPYNEEALMVGLTVSGRVTGYAKGKALIRLDGSKFTGIMNPNDVQSIDKQEPIEKSMKLGTHYTMKIIQLSNQGRRLIRLSTLSKYFNKFKGVELGFEADENAVNLWDNYQQMLEIEAPANNIQAIIEHEDENEEDEYERIKRMVNTEMGGEDGEPEGEEDGEAEEQDEDDEKDPQESQQNKQSEAEMQDEQHQEKQSKHGLETPLSKQQVNRRLSQFRQMNQTPQVYQSIVLANDSSQSHLQYISALISNPSVTADQIRDQFTKSIAILQSLKDKQNMWIAWLNMELILGDFMGLVKKAIAADSGLPVYNRVVEILREQEKWDLAFEMAKKMLKKYNKEIKAYFLMLKHMVAEETHLSKSTLTLKELLRRASQCLHVKDLITIESHYGKILYEESKAEQARTVFSNILTNNPKRTDIWSMYVDLEIKHGNIEKAREIFQRCLTIKLKRKKIISILKKYHQMEQQHGTAKTAAAVLERAQRIAEQMQDEKQEESDKNQ